MYNLGVCYYNGWGVARSQNKAIEFFRLAADLGDEECAQILKDNNW